MVSCNLRYGDWTPPLHHLSILTIDILEGKVNFGHPSNTCGLFEKKSAMKLWPNNCNFCVWPWNFFFQRSRIDDPLLWIENFNFEAFTLLQNGFTSLFCSSNMSHTCGSYGSSILWKQHMAHNEIVVPYHWHSSSLVHSGSRLHTTYCW